MSFHQHNVRIAHDLHSSIFPPTDQAYLAFALAKQFEPRSVSLPFGAKAHWVIGSPSDERMLVHFHGQSIPGYLHNDSELIDLGGAYIYPPAMQFEFFWKLKDDVARGSAIVLLSYSLGTTGSCYPVQLRQAAGCLGYLINTCGKRPENVSDDNYQFFIISPD